MARRQAQKSEMMATQPMEMGARETALGLSQAGFAAEVVLHPLTHVHFVLQVSTKITLPIPQYE